LKGGIPLNGNHCNVDCPVGKVLEERTENMSRRIDGHDADIDKLQNRLPTWATFVIATLTAACGWLVK
jgi:hypothetical protein